MLQSALSEQFQHTPCPILLLCCGEVYSQAGDMVTALDCFRKAHALAPNNPLSYVNSARTYQQLNQVSVGCVGAVCFCVVKVLFVLACGVLICCRPVN